ncbi:MAG: hypothetical protein O2856_04055 [Planctomycetota bacterium]|nr:hypothetical protein [Planctomycetota bacterium]
MTEYQDGDTLICWGKGATSGIIKRWLNVRHLFKWMLRKFSSAPSHIAFIVLDPDSDQPVVFESTSMSALEDYYAQCQRVGVQAHAIEDWLAATTSKVELWRLKVPPTDAGLKRMKEYVYEAHARQAEYDMPQAIGSGMSVIRNTENGKELFCSEFWAFAMENAGSISKSVNCSEVNPLMVTEMPCLVRVKELRTDNATD